MSLDARHLEDAAHHQGGRPSAVPGDGIDPLVKAVQDDHKFELDTKIYNYAVGTGLDSGHKGGLRLGGYSKAGGGAGESAGKRAARRAYEEALLHALQAGDIGNFIADQVFDPKSDAEIAAIVDHIEEVTGGSLEDYAAGILGPEEAKRGPYESDADYQRRIVKAVTAEIVDPASDPDSGIVIKPQFVNDPLAQYLYGDELFQQAQQDLKDGKSIEEVASQGYVSAEAASNAPEGDGPEPTAKDIQAGQREAAISGENDFSENTDIFATIGQPSVAEQASENGRVEFNKKAAVMSNPDLETISSPNPVPGLG